VTFGPRPSGAGGSDHLDARLHHMATATMRAAAACLVVVPGLLIVSCSDEPDRSVASYCARVQADIETINSPSIATSADITATLDLYRGIGDHAPADVAPEWVVMIDSLETAATLVPGDAAGTAAVTEAALSSQAAATRIQLYTRNNCGTDIGTPPAPTNPVTVTTVAAATTTAAG
jgi:hypothetical protein